MLKTSLTNLVLRGLTLASKFALMMLIARHATPADMGIYGLMAVSISIALYLVGMDFYVYNTRELLARPEPERLPLIRDQLVFHSVAYALVLPALMIVFWGGILDWRLVGWFYGLLVLEHLCLEVGRLLVAMSHPVAANLVLFGRGTVLLAVVTALSFVHSRRVELDYVWFGWSAGIVTGLIIGLWYLRGLGWRHVSAVPVDWRWIRRGLKVALPYLSATAALLGVQYTDRYFLQQYHGEATVGVYTFFAGFSNVVQVFAFTGITMIMYPRIVAAYQSGKTREYRDLMRKLAVRIAAAVVVLTIAAATLIHPVLSLVGKEVYAVNLSIFWIMLASTGLFALADIPHYALYVRGRDKALVLSTLGAFAVGLMANVFLVPDFGLAGAATATCCAMATLVTAKGALLLHYRKKDLAKSSIRPVVQDISIEAEVALESTPLER
ncbi:MAG: polysaccharide biosynthesis C-terminal domain-containing protein [Candidatus Zixiibacteriota bacterium]